MYCHNAVERENHSNFLPYLRVNCTGFVLLHGAAAAQNHRREFRAVGRHVVPLEEKILLCLLAFVLRKRGRARAGQTNLGVVSNVGRCC